MRIKVQLILFKDPCIESSRPMTRNAIQLIRPQGKIHQPGMIEPVIYNSNFFSRRHNSYQFFERLCLHFLLYMK